ncbi:uncharacterized protein LOC114300647 [Camellia sinensis]|uniref:uncharacterized protein LOC114300647 n=1 Tax=Camellia sinensis TaxID=4442 RepID=UPI001036ACE7|nr:uncharacterized protein LOC114300647 [Camellia sinensis]
MDKWEAAQAYLLGEVPPLARPGFVRYSWFEVQFRVQSALTEEALMTQEAMEQYARGFLMFLLGTTIFTDWANIVPLCLLSALVDATQILRYDWGGAALATLYGYMTQLPVAADSCSGVIGALGSCGSMPTFRDSPPCQMRRPLSSFHFRAISTGGACGGLGRRLASSAAILTPSLPFLEMASHFPQGGGPPGAGGEPDIMSLPPRIRPFIPERYLPVLHEDMDRSSPGSGTRSSQRPFAIWLTRQGSDPSAWGYHVIQRAGP